MQEFTAVGKVDEFAPGEIRDVKVNGGTICVARTGDSFHAFSSLCTHEYIPLSFGYLSDGCVFCGQHDAGFDLATGQVVSGPADFDLSVYPVKIENGEVLVGSEPAEAGS
jgi:nitrite reductase/ring-hydroxylating ferredoxin subunit